jgi:hypothetical protein
MAVPGDWTLVFEEALLWWSVQSLRRLLAPSSGTSFDNGWKVDRAGCGNFEPEVHQRFYVSPFFVWQMPRGWQVLHDRGRRQGAKNRPETSLMPPGIFEEEKHLIGEPSISRAPVVHHRCRGGCSFGKMNLFILPGVCPHRHSPMSIRYTVFLLFSASVVVFARDYLSMRPCNKAFRGKVSARIYRWYKICLYAH